MNKKEVIEALKLIKEISTIIMNKEIIPDDKKRI